MTEENDKTQDTESEIQRIVVAAKRLTPRPYKVRVTLADGNERDIKISGTAKSRPWAKLRKLLSVLEWVRVEAMDSRNNLLGTWDNDADDADDESLDDEPRVIALAVKFTRLVVEAQDHALDRQTKHMEALLAGATKALDVVTRSADAMARLYERRLQVAEQLAGTGDGDLMSGGLIEALVAQKMGLTPAPPGDAKPNGQPKG